jgi:hypothetical protein
MKARTHIVTLAAAALTALGSQAAQAHPLYASDSAAAGKAAASSSALTAAAVAGIRYHAAANFRNEKHLVAARAVRGSHGPGGVVVPRIVYVAPSSAPTPPSQLDTCMTSMADCTDQQACDLWGFNCDLVESAPAIGAEPARP